MPRRKLVIHKYRVRPGKLSIIELLVLLGRELLENLFPDGLLPPSWPWIGVNSWLTMLMMTGEIPLIPYHITLNTCDRDIPVWWDNYIDRQGVAQVMDDLLYVQSWDVPPEINSVSFNFVLLGSSMLDEDGFRLPEAIEEAMWAANFILTVSADSIIRASLGADDRIQPLEFWKKLPELTKLEYLSYSGELYTQDRDEYGNGMPFFLIDFVPAWIQILSLSRCNGFSGSTVRKFVQRVKDGDFHQLEDLYLEQVFGELDSTRDACNLLDALATLPKLQNLQIGPVIRSKKVQAAVETFKLSRPGVYVDSDGW
jgi:hypothetical protein